MPNVKAEEKDVSLVEYVGTIGGVEDNYGKPSNFVVHGNISNVENVHMQVVTTHFWTARTHSIVTIDCIEVEVMQLVIIQIQVVA